LAQKVIRVRKRPTKEGEHQIFAGLLKCSTCGQGLSFARGGSSKTSGGKGGRGSFACNQARTRGKAYCSFHYISYVDIYEIILADIRRHAQTAKEKASAFAEKLAMVSQNQQKKQWSAAMKERVRLNRRESELQTIQRKLYEDNALGKITNEQYVALSRDFTAEQAQLKERLKQLDDQLQKAENKQENTTRFLELVREYTDMRELTKPILNELIDKVVVYDAEKIGGKRVQRIDSYYRFVGLIW
jgi:site-specific DNA recombinase